LFQAPPIDLANNVTWVWRAPDSALGRLMSPYQMQKFLFDINRHRDLRREIRRDLPAVLDRYTLGAEDRGTLEARDIGLTMCWAPTGNC
jgi:hypothetical protein